MFLINGEPSETISVHDRGLQYGDGLFETLAVQNNQPLCWARHFARLQLGCQRLKIDCPAEKLILSDVNRLCMDTKQAVLKMIITRGAGGRGYKSLQTELPTRIIAIYPWPDYPGENITHGVKVHICETRMGHNPILAGIKHLNRLEQVLASNEWRDPDIAEGLVLDIEGNVIEGTMSNLFAVRGNLGYTPDLDRCGVEGIVREYILETAAELNFEIEIKRIKLDDLLAVDEIFLCNSTFGIWPVRQIETHKFDPGSWSARLREHLIKHQVIVG